MIHPCIHINAAVCDISYITHCVLHTLCFYIQDTLVAIYKSLIGFVIDYSAFMSSQLSDNLRKSVQAIQNIAMRIIFKQPFDASTDSLSALSGLPLVRDRMYELNRRYFEAARTVPNELIVDLMTSFTNFKMSFKAKTKTMKGIDKTVLCTYRQLYTNALFCDSLYNHNFGNNEWNRNTHLSGNRYARI